MSWRADLEFRGMRTAHGAQEVLRYGASARATRNSKSTYKLIQNTGWHVDLGPRGDAARLLEPGGVTVFSSVFFFIIIVIFFFLSCRAPPARLPSSSVFFIRRKSRRRILPLPQQHADATFGLQMNLNRADLPKTLRFHYGSKGYGESTRSHRTPVRTSTFAGISRSQSICIHVKSLDFQPRCCVPAFPN